MTTSTTQQRRVLLIDIESTPNLVWTFQTWQVNISKDKLVKPSTMLCFAAKWLDDPEVMYWSTFHDGREEMLSNLWRLMDEADVLLHYNGARFDVPYINKELLLAGYTPPSPYKQIDLYKVVRSKFSFTYKSLDFVTQELGLDRKLENGGFQLWLDCMNGDKKAWKMMRKYNMQDVVIMEPLFYKLRPWIPGIPSLAAFTGENVCPACGSDHIVKRGWDYTTTSRFQRYVCRDCGKHSRGTKRDQATLVTSIAGA